MHSGNSDPRSLVKLWAVSYTSLHRISSASQRNNDVNTITEPKKIMSLQINLAPKFMSRLVYAKQSYWLHYGDKDCMAERTALAINNDGFYFYDSKGKVEFAVSHWLFFN